MMILFWTEQENMKKGFRRACLLGKFISLHVLLFSEIEDYRKILLYYFSCTWSFFAILWFLCIVWYVVATSSWIFMPNKEKCGFKYLF